MHPESRRPEVAGSTPERLLSPLERVQKARHEIRMDSALNAFVDAAEVMEVFEDLVPRLDDMDLVTLERSLKAVHKSAEENDGTPKKTYVEALRSDIMQMKARYADQ